jgi:hypothetical protein
LPIAGVFAVANMRHTAFVHGDKPAPQGLVAGLRVGHAAHVSTGSRTSGRTVTQAAAGRPLADVLALPALDGAVLVPEGGAEGGVGRLASPCPLEDTLEDLHVIKEMQSHVRGHMHKYIHLF